MCSTPVTFGGGITMAYLSGLLSGSLLKYFFQASAHTILLLLFYD
jgi:hypothetical protein